MRRSEFLSGMIIGALIGAMAALLYTPASGDNMRAQVRNTVTRVRSEVSQAAMARRAQLEQQLEALRAPRKPGEE